MFIDETTDIHIKLSTFRGIAEALSNIVAHGYYEDDLYQAVVGCEWDADALAEVFESNSDMLYAYGWRGVRTLPRSLVVEGQDHFGNGKTVYLVLGNGEPDMTDGFSLKVSLTNPSRVALSLSNIVASGHSNEEFKDYLYEAAYEDWSAESFAEAANDAYRDGVIYARDWMAGFTGDDKCRIEGMDSMGNKKIIIVKAI